MPNPLAYRKALSEDEYLEDSRRAWALDKKVNKALGDEASFIIRVATIRAAMHKDAPGATRVAHQFARAVKVAQDLLDE